MMEGRAHPGYNRPEFGPFMLEIREKEKRYNINRLVAEFEIQVDFRPMHEFVRWANFRANPMNYLHLGNTKEHEDRVNSLIPWDENGNKEIAYIHGYNITQAKAHGEAFQMQKKLYWMGSNARLTMVLWEGAETYHEIFKLFLTAGIIPIKTKYDLTPNYLGNAENALDVAPRVGAWLNSTFTEPPALAAHSLGNMVASSAITEHGANVSQYFMINAAVAKEAYIPKETTPPVVDAAMLNQFWNHLTADGLPSRLYASEWYKLFPSDDPRNKLTWRGKFTNWRGTPVHNYYAPSDRVLRNIAANQCNDFLSFNIYFWGIESDAENYPWGAQEKTKGQLGPYAGQLFVPDYGGWRIHIPNQQNHYSNFAPLLNPPYVLKPLTELLDPAHVPDATIQSRPLFSHPPRFRTGQPQIAPRYAERSRNHLLAHVFPATTFATGANPVTGDLTQYEDLKNKNLNDFRTRGWWRTLIPNGNDGWNHSDHLDVPLFYVQDFFKKIVTTGELK